MRSPLVRALPMAAALAGGAACAADDAPTSAPAATPAATTPTAAAGTLRKVRGDSQVGVVGAALPDSLTVALTRADGAPLADAVVRFETLMGGGTVGARATTNAAGVARVQWVLGPAGGPQAVRAVHDGAATVFTANAGTPPSLHFAVVPAPSIGGAATHHEGPLDLQYAVRAEGALRAVMLFVDFSDAPATESPHDVYGRLVPSSAAWFEAASYGRMSLDVVPVARWYRLPRPSTAYGLQTAEEQPTHAYLSDVVAAVDGDVDFARFDIVYVVPTRTRAIPFSPAWPFVAGAGVRSAEGEVRFFVAFGADFYDPARARALPLGLAHETAHLLGLPDLYTRDPGTTLHDLFPFVGGWDLMSFGSTGADFLAWHKFRLGWLRPEQVLALGEGGVEAVLTPVAAPGGLKMIAVPIGTSRALVVELRRPVGLDAAMCDEGVLVYSVHGLVASGRGPIRVAPVGGGADRAMIQRCSVLYDATLDLRPGKASRHDDATLGVSVEVLETTAEGTRVRVRRR